ncbi:DUF7352 domain-containing protein [Priestia megaterium]
MYSVWKFPLVADHSQQLDLPLGSKVLSVESQGDDIVIYALVNTEQTEKEVKEIRAYGTGHDIPNDIIEYTFLGTTKLYNDSMVFHIFYK